MSVRGAKTGIPRAYLPSSPVDPEEFEGLNIIAFADKKPLAEVLREAVQEYLKKRRQTVTKNREKYRQSRFDDRAQRG